MNFEPRRGDIFWFVPDDAASAVLGCFVVSDVINMSPLTALGFGGTLQKSGRQV
jgi:hypothetical protein